MVLRTDANLVFTDYQVVDDGIVFHFVSSDPGPGENSDYYVTMTDAELNAITTAAQLRTALTTKLSRKYRAAGIASRLDSFVGQSITV